MTNNETVDVVTFSWKPENEKEMWKTINEIRKILRDKEE